MGWAGPKSSVACREGKVLEPDLCVELAGIPSKACNTSSPQQNIRDAAHLFTVMFQVIKWLSIPPWIHTGWELALSLLHLEKPINRLEEL